MRCFGFSAAIWHLSAASAACLCGGCPRLAPYSHQPDAARSPVDLLLHFMSLRSMCYHPPISNQEHLMELAHEGILLLDNIGYVHQQLRTAGPTNNEAYVQRHIRPAASTYFCYYRRVSTACFRDRQRRAHCRLGH